VSTPAYLSVGIVLTVFGVLSVFSIGVPFLLTGVVMLALVRLRSRREILLPALAWPWLFTLGYVLVGPLGCGASARSAGPGHPGGVAGPTMCRSLFVPYEGGPSYAPPLWPAVVTGVVLATVVALVIHHVVARGHASAPRG
jgi:hypothetical protein